jgi:hypothetical protein
LGYRPSGYRPSGYRPSGYRPSGYRPSGYRPSGDRLSGYPAGRQSAIGFNGLSLARLSFPGALEELA